MQYRGVKCNIDYSPHFEDICGREIWDRYDSVGQKIRRGEVVCLPTTVHSISTTDNTVVWNTIIEIVLHYHYLTLITIPFLITINIYYNSITIISLLIKYNYQ